VTWLAVWLIGLGLADLARSTGGRAARFAPVVGSATVGAVAALAGLTAPLDIVVLVASLVPLALWLRLSDRALVTGSGQVRSLAALVAGALWLVGFSGWSTTAGGLLGRWLAWADVPVVGADATPEAVLLVLGLGLVNVATGNVVVRLVLVSIGALRPVRHLAPGPDFARDPEPAEQLRGGRLLGPMERMLILGLGLAGQVTAAGLVIAAKGLIRFPELQAVRDERTAIEGVGIDEVTEYFLVGSFVSWLFALGSLALTR
jgi:hypothetical protein